MAAIAGVTIMLAAGAAASGAAQVPATLRNALEQRYPQAHIVEIRPALIAGLYEVYAGDTIFYADATGSYLLLGSLVDTRTKADLSRRHLDAFNSVDFRRLPVDQSIRTVRGSGARRIAIFEDPDCPYCRQLEKELLQITDVTIYTYLYPLTDVHPSARGNAHAIWCAADRTQAWHDWMIDGRIPLSSAACADDPIDALQALGNDLHISSTPTLFLEQGTRITGTVKASELEALLKTQSEAAVSSPPKTGL